MALYKMTETRCHAWLYNMSGESSWLYNSGAYPGFSEGGGDEGGRDPPKKLTSQRSVQLG